jgi:hypothetical protein
MRGDGGLAAGRIFAICGMVEILPRFLRPSEALGTQKARSVAGAPRTARRKNPATPVPSASLKAGGMTENSRAARLRRQALQWQENAPASEGGRYKGERSAQSGVTVPQIGKTAGAGGRITEAETRVLGGAAKFEGTCPLVQVIIAGSQPQVRGLTHPSRMRGTEPECQL